MLTKRSAASGDGNGTTVDPLLLSVVVVYNSLIFPSNRCQEQLDSNQNRRGGGGGGEGASRESFYLRFLEAGKFRSLKISCFFLVESKWRLS